MARVRPRRRDSTGVEVCRPQGSREQFTHRHDARAQPVAHLAVALGGGRHLGEFLQEDFELWARHDAERTCQVAVPRFDSCERAGVRCRHCGAEQRLETVGDSGERRMNDHRPQGGGDTGSDDTRDIVPIGCRGHARAPELEHDPSLTIFRHSGERRDLELIVFENVAQFFF